MSSLFFVIKTLKVRQCFLILYHYQLPVQDTCLNITLPNIEFVPLVVPVFYTWVDPFLSFCNIVDLERQSYENTDPHRGHRWWKVWPHLSTRSLERDCCTSLSPASSDNKDSKGCIWRGAAIVLKFSFVQSIFLLSYLFVSSPGIAKS